MKFQGWNDDGNTHSTLCHYHPNKHFMYQENNFLAKYLLLLEYMFHGEDLLPARIM